MPRINDQEYRYLEKDSLAQVNGFSNAISFIYGNISCIIYKWIFCAETHKKK